MARRKDEDYGFIGSPCEECGQFFSVGELCSVCSCCPTHCDCDPLDKVLGRAIDEDDPKAENHSEISEDDDEDEDEEED